MEQLGFSNRYRQRVLTGAKAHIQSRDGSPPGKLNIWSNVAFRKSQLISVLPKFFDGLSICGGDHRDQLGQLGQGRVRHVLCDGAEGISMPVDLAHTIAGNHRQNTRRRHRIELSAKLAVRLKKSQKPVAVISAASAPAPISCALVDTMTPCTKRSISFPLIPACFRTWWIPTAMALRTPRARRHLVDILLPGDPIDEYHVSKGPACICRQIADFSLSYARPEARTAHSGMKFVASYRCCADAP